VLEVFGEHRLSTIEILSLLALSLVLIGGYVAHGRRTAFPLLNLQLVAQRTFRVAVLGSFISRLGVGGVPFLLPLLYQVGLGMSAVQSGLLIVPQALAAMSTKFWAPHVLELLGYRIILVANTLLIGVLILLFGTVGTATPIWLIVIQALCYGAFMSLQFTSMNTLVYADIGEADTSAASTIASTMQQMSISFGVAVAGLATVFFLPDPTRQTPAAMIHGIHAAFLVLGAFTILSTIVFRELKADDGQAVSKQKALEIG
jgi:MFS family permease